MISTRCCLQRTPTVQPKPADRDECPRYPDLLPVLVISPEELTAGSLPYWLLGRALGLPATARLAASARRGIRPEAPASAFRGAGRLLGRAARIRSRRGCRSRAVFALASLVDRK